MRSAAVFAAAEAAPAIPLTYFEALTAAAFVAFAERRLDLAILEVGLGGRFDATNVAPAIALGRDVDRARPHRGARAHARADRRRRRPASSAPGGRPSPARSRPRRARRCARRRPPPGPSGTTPARSCTSPSRRSRRRAPAFGSGLRAPDVRARDAAARRAPGLERRARGPRGGAARRTPSRGSSRRAARRRARARAVAGPPRAVPRRAAGSSCSTAATTPRAPRRSPRFLRASGLSGAAPSSSARWPTRTSRGSRRILLPAAAVVFLAPAASPRAAGAGGARGARVAGRARTAIPTEGVAEALARALCESPGADPIIVAGSLYLVGEARAWLLSHGHATP